MLEIIVANKFAIVSFLLVCSEILGLNPKIKENSLYQVFVSVCKKIIGKE